MWARIEQQGGSGYSPLRSEGAQPRGLSPRLTSQTISANLATTERDDRVSGQWYSEGTYFFNLSLSGRPVSARGRFEAVGGDYEPVGDVFFIPAGQRYLARGGPGQQRALFVEMRADDLLREEVRLATYPSTILRVCMNLPFDRVRQLLVEIAREVREPGFASGILLEGLGLTLLAETLRMLQKVEATSARKGGLSPWRMRMIEARVRDGVGAPSLADLAELCGLSTRQLMRAFREETGQTIGSFTQLIMLERARNLLGETDLPIVEVARESGFNSAPAFATAFRRATGVSPREFRASGGSL